MQADKRFAACYVPQPGEFSALKTSVSDPSQVKVSAIVSTYNSEKYFRGCMEDLVSQTLFANNSLEVVIVDSNSPQAEQKIADEYLTSYPNITYLRTVNREPLYHAWNRGIQAALGAYVCNANTDDRHRKDALQILRETLDANPGVALAYGDSIVTPTENESFELCSVQSYLEYPDFDRVHQIHFGQCGPQPMWRKVLHRMHGWFLHGFPRCADYEWWLRLGEHYEFAHVPQLLGLYLDSPSSIEHREPQKTLIETDTIRNFYAAKANIALEHGKYRNEVVQPFYSRHSSQSESLRCAATVVSTAPRCSDALGLARDLFDASLETERNELILIGQVDCSLASTFAPFEKRVRVRSVQSNAQFPELLKAGYGAMHASTQRVLFADPGTTDLKARMRFLAERKQTSDTEIVVLKSTEPGKVVGNDPVRILSQASFSRPVLDILTRTGNPSETYQVLMEICKRVEPNVTFTGQA